MRASKVAHAIKGGVSAAALMIRSVFVPEQALKQLDQATEEPAVDSPGEN